MTATLTEANPASARTRAGDMAARLGYTAAVSTRPVHALAVLHSHADAEAARAIAANMGAEQKAFLIPQSDDLGRVTFGPSVGVAFVWSHAAAQAGMAAPVLAHAFGQGGAVVGLIRLDGAAVPAALAGIPQFGPGDPALLGATLSAHLQALKAAGAEAQAAYTTPGVGFGGFASGLAASFAVFGIAGVGAHVFLPALASPAMEPTARVVGAHAVAENAYAAAPAVRTSYATAQADAVISDGVVSARFGAEMRVAFASTPQPVATTAAVAPIKRPDPIPAVIAVADAAGAAATPEPISTIAGPETVFGPPVQTAGRLGVAPAFITDMDSGESFDH